MERDAHRDDDSRVPIKHVSAGEDWQPSLVRRSRIYADMVKRVVVEVKPVRLRALWFGRRVLRRPLSPSRIASAGSFADHILGDEAVGGRVLDPVCLGDDGSVAGSKTGGVGHGLLAEVVRGGDERVLKGLRGAVRLSGDL